MLKNLINKRVVGVAPDTNVADVARKMSEENVGAILVLDDDGTPRGIVTDRDIVDRCIAKNVDVNDCTVEQILTEPIEVIKETEGIYDCIRKMRSLKIRRMPVVDEAGKAVGLVSSGDLIGILAQEFSDLAEATSPFGEAAKAGRLKAA